MSLIYPLIMQIGIIGQKMTWILWKMLTSQMYLCITNNWTFHSGGDNKNYEVNGGCQECKFQNISFKIYGDNMHENKLIRKA